MKKFISHPRTGSHWLIGLINEYTNVDRHSLFTHQHDDKLIHKFSDVDLYLYRDPTDVIYSYCVALNDMSDSNIDLMSEQYKNHLLWYLNNSKIILTYDSLFNKDYNQIKLVISLFDEWDEERFNDIYELVDKSYTINYVKGNKNFYSSNLLTKEYENNRNSFIINHGDKIKNNFSFLKDFKTKL
jgi:hypothetical protein